MCCERVKVSRTLAVRDKSPVGGAGYLSADISILFILSPSLTDLNSRQQRGVLIVLTLCNMTLREQALTIAAIGHGEGLVEQENLRELLPIKLHMEKPIPTHQLPIEAAVTVAFGNRAWVP